MICFGAEFIMAKISPFIARIGQFARAALEASLEASRGLPAKATPEQIQMATHCGYFSRLHGGSPAQVAAADGFPENKDLVLTSLSIAMHQLGKKPLGFGSNLTLEHLYNGFLNFHPECKERTLFGLYGNALNLIQLKALIGEEYDKTGDQTESMFNNEYEFIFHEKVPFNQFLFATSFQHRDSFDKGLRVPNELFKFNPTLPKVLTKNDIKDLNSTLGWLLEHNAKEPLHDMVAQIFSKTNPEFHPPVLKGNKELAQVIKDFLEKESEQLSKGPQ